MKVFFDIITNHTADVIAYQSGQYGYISKSTRSLQGRQRHRLRRQGATPMWRHLPAAGPATSSFPNMPVFRTLADETVKVPAWLNDPTLYHNRGDSTFAGESRSTATSSAWTTCSPSSRRSATG